MAQHTIYRKKYGVIRTAPANSSLEAHQSGYTPLSPFYPISQSRTKVAESPRSLRARLTKRWDIEEYQRGALRDFTTQELFELDAISNRDMKHSSLTNPLHEIFKRENWLTEIDCQREGFSVYERQGPGQTSGHWLAQDQVAWDAIYPSLRLASQLIANLHLHPWFSALLDKSTWCAIDDNRFDPEDSHLLNGLRYTNFRLQDPWLYNPDIERRKMEHIVSTIFRPYLRLGFKSYVEEPAISEQIYDTTPSSGITYHVTDGLRLFVNHDLVAPLLRDDLSDAERLGLQWFVANTLVHEIMHAVGFALTMWDSSGNPLNSGHIDFYFQNEHLSEPGQSAEAAIWGGFADPWLLGQSQLPLGFWIEQFPVDQTTGNPELLYPVPDSRTAWPLPVTFYEALQQQDYWSTSFRSFGMIKPPPPISGSTAEHDMIEPIPKWARNSPRALPPNTADIDSLMPLSPPDRRAWLTEMKASQTRKFFELLRQQAENSLPISKRANVIVPQITTAGELCAIQDLVKLLENTENLHRKVIDYLLEHLENDARQPDARLNLEAFNRGLRNYIAYNLAFAPPQITPSLQAMHTRLEIQRLRLAPPGTTLPTVIATDLTFSNAQDIRESNLMIAAEAALNQNDEATVLRNCNEVLNNLGAGFLVRIKARLLRANVNGVAKDRLADVNKARVEIEKVLSGLHSGGIQDAGGTRAALLLLKGEMERLKAAWEQLVDAEKRLRLTSRTSK